MTIRLASREDVPAIMALEARYFVGNLDPSQLSDGFISILHSEDWFVRAVDEGGIHIATGDDGAVAGFIAVTSPPDHAASVSSPIMRAMLELATTLTFNGRPVAQQRFALRGPVLIDRSARGHGLYAAFNDVTRDAYKTRFDLAVLFVAADNPRSLHTTTTSLGAESLAVFEADGKKYHFLAFNF